MTAGVRDSDVAPAPPQLTAPRATLGAAGPVPGRPATPRLRSAVLPAGPRHSVPGAVVASAVVAIAGMPLLVPAGPGNTGLADIGIAVCMAVSAGCALRRGWRIRFPYVLPMLLFVAAGGLALLSVHAAVGGWLALPQDVFTVIWGCALANLARDPRALRAMVGTWAWAGTGWAALMLLGVFTKQDWLSGVTARNGSRAALTFGDANLAAGYFVTSLLIVRAARVPRHRALRYLACGVLLTALLFTGSNGGFLALGIATAAGCVLRLRRTSGARAAAAGALLVLAVGAAATQVNGNSIRTWAQQQAPVLRDSIGRSAASSQSRATIAAESLQLWRSSSLLGIGPTFTKETLQKDQAPYPKEAHDDYAAALIERGVLGAVALVLFLACAWRRLSRVAVRPLRPQFAAVVPRPELLTAAAIGYLASGLFYEVLHFRHLWALLGIATGLDLWGRRQ